MCIRDSIDTLQKVRELSGEAYSYRDDYQIIGQLKQLADKFGLCMLIVHHTRKSAANDEFDRISGTTGIYGCADGAFVLSKENRTDNAATLSVSGQMCIRDSVTPIGGSGDELLAAMLGTEI